MTARGTYHFIVVTIKPDDGASFAITRWAGITGVIPEDQVVPFPCGARVNLAQVYVPVKMKGQVVQEPFQPYFNSYKWQFFSGLPKFTYHLCKTNS